MDRAALPQTSTSTLIVVKNVSLVDSWISTVPCSNDGSLSFSRLAVACLGNMSSAGDHGNKGETFSRKNPSRLVEFNFNSNCYLRHPLVSDHPNPVSVRPAFDYYRKKTLKFAYCLYRASMHRLLIGITIAVTVYVSILIPLSRGQDSSNTTVTTNTTGDDSGDRSGDSGDGDRAAPAANGTSGATNSSKSGNSTDETPKSSAWVTSANVNSPSTWFCNSTATTWPAGTINCFSSPGEHTSIPDWLAFHIFGLSDINMMFKSCKADKGGVTEICVCTEVSFKDPAGAAQNSLTGSNGKPIGIEFPVSMASSTVPPWVQLFVVLILPVLQLLARSRELATDAERQVLLVQQKRLIIPPF